MGKGVMLNTLVSINKVALHKVSVYYLLLKCKQRQ